MKRDPILNPDPIGPHLVTAANLGLAAVTAGTGHASPWFTILQLVIQAFLPSLLKRWRLDPNG